MSGIDLSVGATIATPWRGPINVTPLLAETVPLARAALLAAEALLRTLGLTRTPGWRQIRIPPWPPNS